MTYAKYSVGPPRRPNIRHDNGFLDKFPRRSPTLGERGSYMWWRAKLEGGEAGVPGAPDLPDGYATYRHFLTGRGASRTFSYQRYVSSDASGATTLKSVIREAMKAAYDLHAKQVPVGSGNFSFTGSAITCSETNPDFPYPATENWQKAIGGHSIWISGDVVVTRSKPSGKSPAKTQFALTLVIHAEDRYNFNPGAVDIATGRPDSDNGVFEVTGLATQYTQYATLTRRIGWSGKPTT